MQPVRTRKRLQPLLRRRRRRSHPPSKPIFQLVLKCLPHAAFQALVVARVLHLHPSLTIAMAVDTRFQRVTLTSNRPMRDLQRSKLIVRPRRQQAVRRQRVEMLGNRLPQLEQQQPTQCCLILSHHPPKSPRASTTSHPSLTTFHLKCAIATTEPQLLLQLLAVLVV